MYEGFHTSEDVMREYLIQGSNLDVYGVPELYPINVSPMYDTVDFSASFNYSIKNYKKINVNFYIHDKAFERIWNNADRYIEHMKCFHSVIAPDFSICTGRTGMPFVMNLWNKYRNHALAWYMTVQGIKVIPSVSILDKDNWDWGFSALPKRSVLSCCTNGRVRSKAARLEFCEGFYEMCDRLEPTKVIIVGRIPGELKSPVEIVNYKTRSQKINENMERNNNGNID